MTIYIGASLDIDAIKGCAKRVRSLTTQLEESDRASEIKELAEQIEAAAKLQGALAGQLAHRMTAHLNRRARI